MFARSRALSACPSERLLKSEPKPLAMSVPSPRRRVHSTPSPVSA